jgi:hypothetical protein
VLQDGYILVVSDEYFAYPDGAFFGFSKCEHCPLTNASAQGAQNRRRFAHNGPGDGVIEQ